MLHTGVPVPVVGGYQPYQQKGGKGAAAAPAAAQSGSTSKGKAGGGADSSGGKGSKGGKGGKPGKKREGKVEDPCALYIDGLPAAFGRPDLEALLQQHGKIVRVAVTPVHAGKNHRSALATMATPEEATACITALNGTHVPGAFWPIKVELKTVIERPRSWKTTMCQSWMKDGNCRFKSGCNFAHGMGDLRVPGGERLARKPGCCPKGHLLSQQSSLVLPPGATEMSCSICDLHAPPAGFMGCRVCDWDMCQTCFDGVSEMWTCPQCGYKVYSDRPECPKCSVKNPLMIQSAQQLLLTAPGAEEGEWACKACMTANGPRRDQCRRCKVPKGAENAQHAEEIKQQRKDAYHASPYRPQIEGMIAQWRLNGPILEQLRFSMPLDPHIVQPILDQCMKGLPGARNASAFVASVLKRNLQEQQGTPTPQQHQQQQQPVPVAPPVVQQQQQQQWQPAAPAQWQGGQQWQAGEAAPPVFSVEQQWGGQQQWRAM